MRKDFIFLLLGKGLQIILSLLSVRLLTHLLSEEEVGNYFLILTLVSCCALIFVNPIGMYINREFNKWKNNHTILSNFTIYAFYLNLVIFISMPIFFIAINYFNIGQNVKNSHLVIIIALFIFINTWNTTVIPAFNLLMKRVQFTIFTLLTQIVGLTASYLMVEMLSEKATSWFLGQIAAQGFITFIAYLYFKKLVDEKVKINLTIEKINKESIKVVLIFALPLALATTFMWLQNQSFRIIVENILGAKYMGMLAIGLSVATNISMAFESLVQQFYSPIFYQEINTDDKNKRVRSWEKMVTVSSAIFITLAFYVFMMSPFLTRLLLDIKFYEAYVYVFFGAFIELFRMLTNLFSNLAHSEYKTKKLISPYFYGGIIASVGVYITATQFNNRLLIPSVLVFAGFITFYIMYKNMRKIIGEIKLNLLILRNVTLMCIPFLLGFALYPYSKNMIVSIVSLLLFGIYFCFIQLFIYKKIRSGDI